MSIELDSLRRVNFDWAMRLSEVWEDSAHDVPDLHSALREQLRDQVQAMQGVTRSDSPLGWVLVGAGGSGKTHLLGSFRREVEREQCSFVLVDMTDVRDFWQTVLQGYLGSLQQRIRGGEFQYLWVLRNIIERLGPNKPAARILGMLAEHKSTHLKADIDKVLNALGQVHRAETLKYQDVVRALICLNSENFALANLGMTWLQGQPIEDQDKAAFGFVTNRPEPRKIVEALSWFMSLSGPTVLAFDQLDSIVTQLHFRQLGKDMPDEEARANAIIVEIGGGLGALRDTARNTLTLVSCVESTWEILSKTVLRTYVDRFMPVQRLDAVGEASIARAIVGGRLAAGYALAGFEPPHATWPFRAQAFNDSTTSSPREILKKCEEYRQHFLSLGSISEVDSLGASPGPKRLPPASDRFQTLDALFDRFRAETNPQYLHEPKFEDQRLAPVFRNALACLIRETSLPDSITAIVDTEFTGGVTTRPLHARLRLIFHDESEREEHYCVRAIEQTHANAYKSRLKAAMTQSGIDRSLKFRHLAIVRKHPLPGGPETLKLIKTFEYQGGIHLEPSEDELRTLNAVHRLKLAEEPDFEAWLQHRKPMTGLSCLRAIVPSTYFKGSAQAASREPEKQGQGGERRTEAALSEVAAVDHQSLNMGERRGNVENQSKEADSSFQTENETVGSWHMSRDASFPLGRQLVGGQAGEPVTMPVHLLEKHTVLLAGAGSGKTVLLRRIIEEAAILGVPSIVVDCANDLATLDEPWPEPPQSWEHKDVEKCGQYHDRTQVVVWTPGRDRGHPLSLEPLPDLSALSQDQEELDVAVAMVCDSLQNVVAPGRAAASKNKLGTLSSVLRYQARHGGGPLKRLIEILEDLPAEAGLGVANEEKLGRQMADALKVAIETNPMLRSTGAALDPALLFGVGGEVRTRVSVISFVGLPALEAQRSFLNQLAMTLFTWIKKHPAPLGSPLRGLLVIDEAKDFVPSQGSSSCKESLTRLTAQARKYHLGLVFATQNPKDLDHKIVANCSTHYYGKVNSPAAIDVIRDQLRLRGSSGDDVPRLVRGQFYVHNADARFPSPLKVAIPLCLSRHPSSPLNEVEIMTKAEASRRLLE